MQDKRLREATTQWVATLDVLRSEMPASESRSLIREVFAAFLLLRWADLQEAEQEAMAVFEDRPYQPLLPQALQWRHWVRLDHPQTIADRLHKLANYTEGLRGDAAHPMATYLHALADPLRRVLKVNFVYLIDLVRWVGELPFETPSERRAVLDVFDQVMSETGDTHDGQFSTPSNIARLVAAVANPQPGERVYDPCFGAGNFLVAAWQQAERSRMEQRRPGALLEIAGIEINASTFLIGLTRMLLAGIDSPRLELGNSLERESLSSPSQQGFDVVVAAPPLGMKVNRELATSRHFPIITSDSVGLFIQHALSQLRPHGRAVILVPEGFLFRSGPERDLRRSLIEQGQIEAVIGLPAGALQPITGISVSIIVLSKAGGHQKVKLGQIGSQQKVNTETRLDDFEVDNIVFALNNPGSLPSSLKVIRGLHSRAQKIARQANDLPEEVLANWAKPLEKLQHLMKLTANGVSHDSIYRNIWEVDAREFARYDWDLTPRKRERGALEEMLAGIGESLGETSAIVRLGEVAQIIPGRAIKSTELTDKPTEEHSIGYVRIRDLNRGQVDRVSSWLRPNITPQEHRWALLPGDVLVSRSGTLGKAALVRNSVVGGVAANGLYVLRADRQRLDPGFLLAYLASPASQNWLEAQSRGAVTQHLNLAAFGNLPIPVPPIQVQERAATRFREYGTDAVTFLADFTGNKESQRLTTWLTDLGGKIPKFVGGLDDTPALSHFAPIVALAITARRWLDQEQVDNQTARWLMPFTQALLPLSGVEQIPPGPGLLNVLQDSERAIMAVLEQATGHQSDDAQAHAIAVRLLEWLRAVISDLFNVPGLQVSTAPTSLTAGSYAEFSVELENLGALPLRDVRIETQPDWGITEVAYLAEGGSLSVNLRGDVPKQGGNLTLRLLWQARTLSGQVAEGEIELATRLVHPEQAVTTLATELGGSPYVTGSPLEPMHGHSVFYGRDELLGKISRQIAAHGNVVLLEGNRRAGKTSILKHLEGRTAIPGWLAVYASLQGAEGAAQVVGVPTAEVFREIARSIATALTKLDIDVPLPNGQTLASGKPALGVARACREGIGAESPFTDFREYLELVLTVLEPLGLGLVLMLDEFDKLQEGIDNGVTSPQVPENIRFLIQTYPKFSAILTGSRRLKRLREEYWSALYGLGTSIPVTALDTESARKVVTEPVRDQLAFSQEAIERVIEVTARHPYLMQCLCNRVFDYAVQTKSRSITASVVNDAAHSLVRDNEHFASLWDYAALGPEAGRHRRQLILLLCALSFKQGSHIRFGTLHEQLAQVGVDVEDEPLDADLSYLRELELIEFSGEIGDGEYRLAIPLMADWIEQQQDADVVASRARTEAEEESA